MPIKTVAYLRVSTGAQDLAQQKLAILDYARRHRTRVADFVEVHSTSSSRGYAGIKLILITCKQKGYRIHAKLVLRGHVPFLAPWATSGTYTNGKI